MPCAAPRLGDPMLAVSAQPGPGPPGPRHGVQVAAPASCPARVSEPPPMKAALLHEDVEVSSAFQPCLAVVPAALQHPPELAQPALVRGCECTGCRSDAVKDKIPQRERLGSFLLSFLISADS